MIVQKTISPRSWAELLALAFIWGASFLSNRVALAEVGVCTVVAMRVLTGMVLLWGYVWYKGLAIPRKPLIWLFFLIQGLINNAIPFTLIVWGQQHIDSGLASILNASTVVFAVVFASLAFPDERLTPRRAVGVALGFLGMAMAVGLSALRHLDVTSAAQLAVIASSVSYACAGIFARKVFRGIAPQVIAAGMLTGASVVMLPVALLTEGWPSLSYTPATWGALAYLGVFAGALAYLLYYRVLAAAGAGNLLLVTLLLAPIAIVLGAVVFAEALSPGAYAGFALLALGLAVIDGRALRPFRH